LSAAQGRSEKQSWPKNDISFFFRRYISKLSPAFIAFIVNAL